MEGAPLSTYGATPGARLVLVLGPRALLVKMRGTILSAFLVQELGFTSLTTDLRPTDRLAILTAILSRARGSAGCRVSDEV
jgi:hypothetical protein